MGGEKVALCVTAAEARRFLGLLVPRCVGEERCLLKSVSVCDLKKLTGIWASSPNGTKRGLSGRSVVNWGLGSRSATENVGLLGGARVVWCGGVRGGRGSR